jgi:hypothetical protein
MLEMDLLAGLNPQQQQAVMAGNPVLVLAGLDPARRV